LVGILAQLDFERRQIGRTTAATNTAPQEGVDPLLVGSVALVNNTQEASVSQENHTSIMASSQPEMNIDNE